jgi:hypothetical protein
MLKNSVIVKYIEKPVQPVQPFHNYPKNRFSKVQLEHYVKSRFLHDSSILESSGKDRNDLIFSIIELGRISFHFNLEVSREIDEWRKVNQL